MKELDLVGQKFNRLKAVEKTKVNGRNCYICECDCGKIKTIDGAKLKSGATRSCGCAMKGIAKPHFRKGVGEAARNVVLTWYKRNAKRRNLDFQLSDEECFILFQGCCHYCGVEPKSVCVRNRMYGSYRYNGIDRKDNTEPYTPDNCVSCCTKCNNAKGQLTTQEFKSWITSVYQHCVNGD